jgi:uncharacterized membrane protein
MNKIFTTLLLLLGFIAGAQVKIGDNPTTVSPGAALEIESTNKGLVIPRVANTAAILNPVNGMIIYDISSECFKGYQNGEWSGCGMTLSATASILAQIGAEGDSPDIVPSQVSASQLYSLGVTGVVPAYEGAYQDYIDANPGLFGNPATMAEVQTMINTVNTNVTSILTQIGNEGDNPDVINSVVTISQLESIGVTGITPGNEGAYQDYIDSHPDAFGNPASVAEIQALVTTVNNTVTSVLAQIGIEGDNPDTVNSVVTATQLQSIGITGVTPANEGAYQDYIDSHPDSFSSPATLSEIQAMVTSVNNTVTSVLAQIGNEGDNPDTVNSVVTATQLQTVGITGVTPANEVAYQDYIDSHPDSFSSPATLSEIQTMVTSVNNTVTSVLAQIGTEGDTLDTVNSVVTATQLQSIGITGVTSANEGAYQDYIDNHPDSFSSPATLAEVQAMVTSVNNTVTSILAQIGNEGDNPDTVNSVVTVTQLQSVGITGVTPANEVAYQDYIDSHPDSFSNPATLSEIQTMVTSVNNTVTSVLAQIGNEGDSPDTVNSVVTAAQLTSIGITGVTPANEAAYQDYIDANPNSFSSPATLAEVQAMITAVNNAATSGGTAVVSGWNCGGTLTGILMTGTAVSGVTKQVTATVSTVGTYNVTATANGVTFSGSGTFAGTGSQVITLTASGTPAADGANNYTISVSPSCSFSVTSYGLRNVDYRFTGRTGSDQTLSSGTDIIFNDAGTGTIPYNTATGEFSLTAGRTYRLTYSATLVNYSLTSGAWMGINWVHGTTNAHIGSGSTVFPTTWLNNDTSLPLVECIYTPATNHTVKVRVTSGSGTAQLRQGENFAIVQEIGVQKTSNSLTKADYVYAKRTTSTQTITSGTDLIINSAVEGNIPLNTTTGVFTLQANKTYRLSFSAELRSFSSSSGWLGVAWVDATTNAELVTNASGAGAYSVNAGFDDSGLMIINTIYTPSSNQTVKLRSTSSNASAVLQTFGNAVCIQQLEVDSSFATVNYATTNRTANSGNLSPGSDIIMTVKANGAIPYNTSTGVYTLTAGKTYRLTFKGEMQGFSNSTSGYELAAWVDATTNTALTSYGSSAFVPLTYTAAANSGNPVADIIYTPSVNQTVKLRIYGGTGTAVLKGATHQVTVQELGKSTN